METSLILIHTRQLFQTNLVSFISQFVNQNYYFCMCHILSQCTQQVENEMHRWRMLTLARLFAAPVEMFQLHLPAIPTIYDDYQNSSA